MLSNTSFASIHRFRNSRQDSRVSSARSIGYYAPREDRLEQVTKLRTASFNLGFDKPNYVSAAQEQNMGDLASVKRNPITGAVDSHRSRVASARSVNSDLGHVSASKIADKLRARNWSLAHTGAGENRSEPQTMQRRFFDSKERNNEEYVKEKETWKGQQDYLKASHISLSVKKYGNTFTTTNVEREKNMAASSRNLNCDSSQGSMRSLGGGLQGGVSTTSLKKSSICLGIDKKYHNYKDARSTFQDGFRLPLSIQGRGYSQLASIKEKALDRVESGNTLENDKLPDSSRLKTKDEDLISVNSNDYYGQQKQMSQTMGNFKFSFKGDKGSVNRFNDAKAQDKMQPNFDQIKSKVGPPRSRSHYEEFLKSQGSSRESPSPRGRQKSGERSLDIFTGGRSAGSRDRDYQSMQKVMQMQGLSLQTRNEDYYKTQSIYQKMKLGARTKNYVYDNEAQPATPLKSITGADLDKNQKIINRLGLTEQMEKYINHDLGLIQEEQEVNQSYRRTAGKSNVQLQTHKNRLVGASTTYTDGHPEKKAKNAEMQRQYERLRDYDRESSQQRHKVSQAQHQKVQLRALQRAGKEEEVELARQQAVEDQFTSEQKGNFSRTKLVKAYGLAQAHRQEKAAIAAKGKSQHFDIARQTHQGALAPPAGPAYARVAGYNAGRGHRASIPDVKALVLAQAKVPAAILAASRKVTLPHQDRVPAYPGSFFNNGHVYKMPSINAGIKGITPVFTKRPGVNVKNYEDANRPKLASNLGAVSRFDARANRPGSTILQLQPPALLLHRADKRGGTVGQTSPVGPTERYSSLTSVLTQARATLPASGPTQALDPNEYRQPRLLKQAFDNLGAGQQTGDATPGSLAHIQKIYTDTRLLRRIFKKEAEGQASQQSQALKELPVVAPGLRAKSQVQSPPREDQAAALQRRRQSEAQYKTSNQSFMRWIQPVPRAKNA